MGRYGGENLTADSLDVPGTEVVPEQAGDIGRAFAGWPKAAANSARVKTG